MANGAGNGTGGKKNGLRNGSGIATIEHSENKEKTQKEINIMSEIRKIENFAAPELDVYARLSEPQLLHYYEPQPGLFLAESPRVIERALDAGYVPISFLMEEKYLENQGKAFMERCPDELKFFNSFVDKTLLDRLTNVVENDFARVTYTEAVELLKKSGAEFKYPVDWGCDLQTEHERYLTEQIFKRPVFVTNYPKDIKAFYMRLNDDGKTVAAVDLLVPGVGEIIGGSQREERTDKLKQRIEELGLDMSQYDWYMDLRRFGGVQHAGYGLGFERMVMYVTGIANIRDVLPFPRTASSMDI